MNQIQLNKNQDRYLAIKVLIGCVLFVLIAYWFSENDSAYRDVLLHRVSVQSFDVLVNSVGSVDAENSITISSDLSGEKAKIISIINDGELVNSGDVLVEFGTAPFDDAVNLYQGQVDELTAALDAMQQSVEWESSQADREIKAAEFLVISTKSSYEKLVHGDGPIELSNLEREYEEQKREYEKRVEYQKALEGLKAQGIKNNAEWVKSAAEIKKFKVLYDISLRRYNSYKEHVLPSEIKQSESEIARAQMELGQSKRASTHKIAQTEAGRRKIKYKLRLASDRLKEAVRDLENTVIKSPIDGIAVLAEGFFSNGTRKHRTGDKVWKNKPIIYLPDTSSFIIRTQVREIELNKIKKGSSAFVTIEAYPNKPFQATIISIGTMAKSLNDHKQKYFGVVLKLVESDTRLRPGMTSRLSILGDNISNVIATPIESVFSKGKEKFCYVNTLTGFRLQPIRVGRQNEFWVEVLSGLEVGDEVSLVNPETL